MNPKAQGCGGCEEVRASNTLMKRNENAKIQQGTEQYNFMTN